MSDHAHGSTFEDFWPRYLREHANPRTRALHIIGTMAAVSCVGVFAVTKNWWWLPAGLVGAYGSAWFAHATIEGNRPSTLEFPLLSMRSDLAMLAHALRGTLDEECAKAGAAS